MKKFLISPGYGAGWSTWNSSDGAEVTKFFLFHAPTIEAIEAGKTQDEWLPKFEADFAAKFPNEDTGYLGGAGDLVVREVPEGTGIQVNEYDGSESYSTQDQQIWF